MKPWKVIFATLVIFGAGVMTGALAVRISTQTKQRNTAQPAHAAKNKDKTPKPVTKPDFLQRLERELALTPEQRTQIEKALADGHKRTKALWEPIHPQFRSEVTRLEGEIRACLKPEQAVKFEQLIKPKVTAKTDEPFDAKPGDKAKPLRTPAVKPPMIPAPAHDKKLGATNAPGGLAAPPSGASATNAVPQL